MWSEYVALPPTDANDSMLFAKGCTTYGIGPPPAVASAIMAQPDPNRYPTLPPGASRSAHDFALAVRRPIEDFLHIEAAGGIVLLVAATIAVLWANSPVADWYQALWHTPIGLSLGGWSFSRDLHFWINDGLMTVFFLVVGLEVKREIVQGALASWQRAALPIAAAFGGMVVPAALYVLLNPAEPFRAGWGVPMATDIAFAVGILTLLGKRVSPSMRVLLLALAIIDDVGAILVIAVFYTSNLNPTGFYLAGFGLLVLYTFVRTGVRPAIGLLAIPLIIIWAGLFTAGIHPTLAGVIVGLAVPVQPWVGAAGFLAMARKAMGDFQVRMTAQASDHDLLEPLEELAFAKREAISPAVWLEHAMHPWVAYAIMPVFALANAGVTLSGISLAEPGLVGVFSGVSLGLFLGKPLGVLLLAWLAVRLRLGTLPVGVSWGGVLVVGLVAGIGFTMAIFIAELAFTSPALLAVAKLGVLASTALAATTALLVGRMLLPLPTVEPAASDSDVERSNEAWHTTETAVRASG